MSNSFFKQLDNLSALKGTDQFSGAKQVLDDDIAKISKNIDIMKQLAGRNNPSLVKALDSELDSLATIKNGLNNPQALKQSLSLLREDAFVKRTIKNLDTKTIVVIDPDTMKPFSRTAGKKFIDDLGDLGNDSWTWMKNNPKKALAVVLIGGSAITIAVILGQAQEEADEINKTEFEITNIQKDDKNQDSTIIEYTPSKVVVKGDKIFINQSDSQPSIDGEHSPTKFNFPGMTTISEKITQDGTQGTLRIQTSFKNRAKDKTESITEAIGGIAGGAAKGLFGGIFDGLGDIGLYLSWGGLVCCLLSFLLVSIILVMRYSD